MNNLLMKFLMGRLFQFNVAEEGGGDGDEAAKAKAAADAAAKAKADEEARLKAEQDAARNKPTDAEAKLLKEVMDKKEALKRSAEALDTANSRLKEFEGLDPTHVKKLLAAQKEAEDNQLAAKGEWDRLKTRMAEEHGKEKAVLLAEVSTSKTKVDELTNTVNELTVGNSFGTSRFIIDELTLTPSKTRVIYGSFFEFKDGKIVGYDKPRGATDRTPLVDASGNSLGFDAALRKIVEADPDKDHMLKSKLKPGAASNTQRGASKAGDGSNEKVESGLDRIRAGLANQAKK